MQAFAARAREHVHTLCVGRTHGIHAEPTTFGIKLAGFAFEADRNASPARAGFRAGRGRRDLRCRRDLLRDLAGLRGAGAAPARAGARARLDTGGRTRPPRGAATGDRARGRRARAVRDRAPPPGADRGRRGARAVRRRAEGLELDAAQAQPDQVRAGRRAGSRAPRQRVGRARERRPVARARHLPLIGRADHPAGLDHPARPHAATRDRAGRRDGRRRSAGCARTSS